MDPMTELESAGARVLIFGEVLWDRFPDGSEVLGGAPFNVAWNLRGLGLAPLLISRVGRDELGERILLHMQKWGLATSGVQEDEEHPTGTVEVRLIDGEPSFEIAAPAAYDFIDHRHIPLDAAPALLYHGSLALREQRSARAARALIEHCRRGTPPGSIFLDVNLRSPWWQAESLTQQCAMADEIKMNEEELRNLVPGHEGLDVRAQILLRRSGARAIFVTRGARGALALTADGQRAENQRSVRGEVVDTVGAGDAFSAVLIFGRLSHWPLQQTLDRARDFAQAVVGLRGATTTEATFYDSFCRAWSRA